MTDRDKAIRLVNAYFDGEEIQMLDPIHGVEEWVSAVNNPHYWSYLESFCQNVNRYRIIRDCPPHKKRSPIVKQLIKLTTMSKNQKNMTKFLIAAAATGLLLYCVSREPMKVQHFIGAALSLITWGWYAVQVFKGDGGNNETPKNKTEDKK